MKRKVILPVVAVGAFFLWIGGFASDDGKEKKEISWQEFSAAVKQGEKENKLIVVDFYTDWCKWCKVMDEKTYGDRQVIDFARKKLVMSKVNAESNVKVKFKGTEWTYRQLSAAFGVNSFPSTIFLTPKGELVTKIPGYIPPDRFLPILEFLEGKHYEKMEFAEFLKKRGGGADSK